MKPLFVRFLSFRFITVAIAVLLVGVAAGVALIYRSDVADLDQWSPDQRSTIEEPISLCGAPDETYRENHRPGSVVTMKQGNQLDGMELLFQEESQGSQGSPALLRVSVRGRTTQIIDMGDARSYSICDANGDGLPDLLLDLGMGARVVNTQAYVYESDLERFVSLQYDGSLKHLQQVFHQLGWDLEADMMLNNAVSEKLNGITLLQQSFWDNDVGTTTCWGLNGNRLEFLAGLDLRRRRPLRGVLGVPNSGPDIRFRMINLSRHQWSSDESGYISDLDCSEIVTTLQRMPTRLIALPVQ
jgi:hypothetical protein